MQTMTRGPDAVRCDICGGIVTDRRRKRHAPGTCQPGDKGRPADSPSGERGKSKTRAFRLYPKDEAILRRLAKKWGINEGACVRRLIREEEDRA